MDLQPIVTYLEKASVDTAAATLYLRLSEYGPTTALQLARFTKISRTQVYRYLEHLIAVGLVKQFPGSSVYSAEPISKLANALDIRQRETQHLLADLPAAIKLMSQGAEDASVEVLPGMGGISQSLWEIVHYGHEYVAISPTTLGSRLSQEQQQALYHFYREKQLRGRLLSNATPTSDIVDGRQIDPAILPIEIETVVAGDRVWLFSATGATALISRPLSVMVGQLFESYWQLAEPTDSV